MACYIKPKYYPQIYLLPQTDTSNLPPFLSTLKAYFTNFCGSGMSIIIKFPITTSNY